MGCRSAARAVVTDTRRPCFMNPPTQSIYVALLLYSFSEDAQKSSIIQSSLTICTCTLRQSLLSAPRLTGHYDATPGFTTTNKYYIPTSRSPKISPHAASAAPAQSSPSILLCTSLAPAAASFPHPADGAHKIHWGSHVGKRQRHGKGMCVHTELHLHGRPCPTSWWPSWVAGGPGG